MISPHGGDIYSAAARLGHPVLDFSANLNPLGMPERVRQAAVDAVLASEPYPDPYCRHLTAALAEFERVPASCVQCGNGAADLIYRLVYTLRPKVGLVLAPTFSEYEQALRAAGADVQRYWLKEDREFCPQEDLLDLLEAPVELVCICNPNNPTGQLMDPVLLRKIAERCHQKGIILLLDECFGDFLENQQAHTLVDLLSVLPNLVILKAFTKLYAMAGLRLGYCLCGDAVLLEEMAQHVQAWSVSTPAQAAGVQALAERQFRADTHTYFLGERPRMQAALKRLGLQVVGSHANYLFFRSVCTDLADRLEGKGLLIRRCSNYAGLDEHFYRAAIRTPEENCQLLRALEEVL